MLHCTTQGAKTLNHWPVRNNDVTGSILLPVTLFTDSAVNLQTNHYMSRRHISRVFLHYLVKHLASSDQTSISQWTFSHSVQTNVTETLFTDMNKKLVANENKRKICK